MNSGTAPWIGIPIQLDPNDDKQYLSRHYSDAIVTVGGLPVIIPLLPTAESMGPLADKLDGILLAGNDSDLDPALYRASRLDACGPTQPCRERMDFFLLETAMKRQIPVLAICFGFQSLNVFLGGTLIQDIPTEIGTRIQHSSPETKGSPIHKIRIEPGSVLEKMAGGLDAMVNSTHHQSVALPGLGLKVIARAPDGVIESVVGTNERHWILGVQWHPEKSFDRHELSRNLFEFFLARCRAVRGIDEGTHT